MAFKEKNPNTEILNYGGEGKRKSRKGVVILVVLIFIATNLISFYSGSFISVAKGDKFVVSSEDYKKLQEVKDVIASSSGDLSKAFAGYSGVLKYKKLFEIKETLNKKYFGNIDEDALVEGAIKGMTAAINDPYTVFMNSKEFQEFNTQTEGAYVGLGIQVGVKNERITVSSTFEDSPADKAGILKGDAIIRVNNKEVTGKDLELAVSMMKGKVGGEVTVTLFREGKGSFDLTLKRAEISIVTVKGEMIDSNIGYIQLSMFDEHSDTDFKKKLVELKGKGMKGLVLDLRSNPGGSLDTCINITSNFVKKGEVLLSTKNKEGKEVKYTSSGGDNIGMPLVVLTDDGTASASEIFSGVVRDYQLGTLIGTTTFGKGVVQEVLYDKNDGTALKVTVSEYFTPSGENIHKKGIKPDMEVKYPAELAEKEYRRDADPQFSKALEVIKGKLK
jgi:carboxyl-terminal processing protease